MGSSFKKGIRKASKLSFILVLLWVTSSSVLLSAKTIRVGYFAKKPIAFRDRNGNAVGLAIDILKDIALEKSWQLKFIYGTFPQVLSQVISAEIDLMVPVGYTKERDKKIDYTSDPFFESWGCLFVKRGGKISSIPDVKGKLIAYIPKSMFYKKFRQLIAGFRISCNFVEVPNYDTLLRGIADGRFDGGVGGRLGLVGFDKTVAKNIDGSIVFSPFSLHLAVVNGDPLNLLSTINHYIINGKEKPDSSFCKHKDFWLSGTVESGSSFLFPLLFALFILLFFCYFLLRISFVRKSLGLTEIVESQVSKNVLISSWVVVVSLWVLDSLGDYLFFNVEGAPFIYKLIAYNDSHDLIMRFFYVIPILIAGIVVSRVFSRLAVQHRLSAKNAENYRITLNSIGDGVVTTDTSGRVTQMNPVAQQLMGLQSGEACGKLLSEVFNIVNAKTKKPVDNPVAKVLALGKVVGLANHTVLISKDGSEYQIADSAAPIKDIDDNIIGVVLVFRDVTEEYRMEEMMIQSEKMLSVGGLAAGMAHEINNPLAGMMQTANVMATRLAGNSQIPANIKAAEEAGISMESLGDYMDARGIPRMLKTINESGQRVADIVNNMLSFARKSDNLKSSYCIEDIIDKTLELAATDYDLKKKYDFKLIDIKKEYEGNLPFVVCEGAKIQQVLLNLFRNGAQAMEMDKTNTPQLIMRTHYDKEKSRVTIEVEDNGPGMNEATRKRVFEPFFTTKPVGVGTGLGLSVSYFIITENNGGELTVESELGEGSKFMISLPVEVGI